jgi:hypothetical protein
MAFPSILFILSFIYEQNMVLFICESGTYCGLGSGLKHLENEGGHVFLVS